MSLSCLLGVLSIAAQTFAFRFGTAFPLLSVAVGLSLQITIGTWYLRNRALSEAGRPIGWVSAAQISALASVLLLAAGLVFLGILLFSTQLQARG